MFFGLKKEPFMHDIKVEEILVTDEVKSVAERMDYAVRLGAVAMITGEVGSGKSASLRWAVNQYHPSEYKIIWITATSGSIVEFYRQLLKGLDIEKSSNSKAFCARLIREEVRDLILEKGQKPIVIIDEASLLRVDVLVELHTINQFEGDSKAWLPLILAGQANLQNNLSYRKAEPLASRVIARGSLGSVSRDNLQTYILHHLQIAGLTKTVFTDDAVTAIYQGSAGIYRKANHLARGAMIAAASEKTLQVNSDHVRKASSEIF